MNRLGTFWIFVLSLVTSTAFANRVDDYHFQVYLDNREIGVHRFEVRHTETQTYVSSEASFDVKFLFVTVYDYLHRNEEVWRGECLQSLTATTKTNGDSVQVKGRYQADGRFVVETPEGKQRLSSCVRSFVYWDPALLKQSRQLLNAQTGELVPVSLQVLGEEGVAVGDSEVRAQRYRLDAGDWQIDLWYHDDTDWVALESTTESGARLRYRIDAPESVRQ